MKSYKKHKNLAKALKFGLIIGLGFAFLSPNAATAEDFKQALVSAYRNNPGLLAERARIREIDENYVQAQAAGRFNASASYSVGRNLSETTTASFFGGSSTSDFWLSPQNKQLSIIKPLYQGGRVRALKAQAKAGILAARQGLRNAEQNLLLATATAYLDVLRDEEAAKIRRNNVLVLTRQKFAAEDRFEVGEGTKTDIAQAESRLAAAEMGLAQAEAQLAVSRAAYVRYTGHPAENLQSPPRFVLPKTLQEAMERGRANNPQLVAARYNENAAQSAIAVAKSAGRPNITLNGALQGGVDNSTFIPRSSSASITAQLRIPLYSGGVNQSKVRAAKAARARSRFETRELERAVDQAIANLWAQVVASERSLVASKKQVESAEIAFEGVQLEQQVGTRDTLDVLNAEQELLDAKLAVIQAERNLSVAIMQLLVTMGGFDAYSLQLPVEHYNPNDNFEKVSTNSFEQKYIPKPVKKIAGQLPNIPADIYKYGYKQGAKPIIGKIGKDVKDLTNALLPDPASVEKVGQDLSNLGNAVIGDAPEKIGKQLPDIPKSAIQAITIDDPFNSDEKPANPDEISPRPILIPVKEKGRK